MGVAYIRDFTVVTLHRFLLYSKSSQSLSPKHAIMCQNWADIDPMQKHRVNKGLVQAQYSIFTGLVISYPDHYCNQIYEAILLATTRSLVTLAESSGCEGDVIRATSALSDAPSGTHTSSHYKSTSPSRATSAASEKSRPVSVLSMLSNMTWTTEKSLEVTYLQWVYGWLGLIGYVTLVAITGTTKLVPYHLVKSLQLVQILGTSRATVTWQRWWHRIMVLAMATN